jgi:hypothetical protein
MTTLFERVAQVASAIASVIAVLFSVFNLVRSIISGEFFPIFMFVILTIFSLCYLGSSIKELVKE